MSSLEHDLFLREWTFSSRLLFYSIVAVTSLTLPVLVIIMALMKPHRTSQYFPYMCGIIMGNIVLLTTVFTLVISENVNVIYHILPGFVICKLSAFLVNSSSCFIHWTWVAMYSQRFVHVFFPLRSRRRLPRSTWSTLLIILLVSCACQIWAPITITEVSLQNGNNSQATYCSEHPYFRSSSKIIVLVESTITFFLPFFLTVTADISVLVSKVPWQTPFKLISADDLRRNNRSDNMKIVSKLNLESAEKRRITAIKRCLISATLTLVLNLPNYVLQVADEFFSLREHREVSIRRIFLQADAAVYILYLLQFPLVPVNMYFLRQNITRSSRKLREKTTLQPDQSRSFQMLEMSNDQSRVPLSTTVPTP
uniref:G_PROTEIN_RECEP_F1_2 domain-containing protein n=1 Tax=Caenorhabditis japonica TaxID=281687 RepID=A0A8R1HK86_CAEJA